MAEKIDTARHRRIGEFFSGLEYIFRKGLQPRRFLLLIVTFLLAGLLALVLGNYAPRVYRDWRQKRLLDRASSLLQEQKFNEAAHMAREAVKVRPFSEGVLRPGRSNRKAKPRGNRIVARTNCA